MASSFTFTRTISMGMSIDFRPIGSEKNPTSPFLRIRNLKTSFFWKIIYSGCAIFMLIFSAKSINVFSVKVLKKANPRKIRLLDYFKNSAFRLFGR